MSDAQGGSAAPVVILRIEHAVPDFERWREAFERDPADRAGSGVRRYQILRARDDANFVFIDLEFDGAAEAEAFLTRMQRIWSGEGRAVMRAPQARIVELVERQALP